MNHTFSYENKGEIQHKIQKLFKDAIKTDPTKPIRRAYNDVIASTDDAANEVPEFSTIRSSLQRTRSSMMPPIPHCHDDVMFEGDWAKTWKGQVFVSCNFDDFENLKLSFLLPRPIYKNLQNVKRYTLTVHFNRAQTLLAVHGMYYDHVIPFVMALTSGKRIGHYRSIVKQQIPNITQKTSTQMKLFAILKFNHQRSTY